MRQNWLKERWAGQSSPTCVSNCLHCPGMDVNTHFMTLLEQVVIQRTVQALKRALSIKIRGVRQNTDTQHQWGGKVLNSFLVKDVRSFANLAQWWTVYLSSITSKCSIYKFSSKTALVEKPSLLPYVVRKHEVTQLMFLESAYCTYCNSPPADLLVE